MAAADAVKLPEHADVVVIGGGAAGLVAAIAAAEAGATTVVFERELECGRTILATGNGRCNFANEALAGPEPAWEAYKDPEFVRAVCGTSFLNDVLGFFADSGLAWAVEDGRYYPLSRQAASVRDVLLARARRADVVLACNRPWDGVASPYPKAALVLATGGPRGEGRPVLCPIACETPEGVNLAELDGRRAHVNARLLRGSAEVAAEKGEALFRPYGVSGIVAFDLSRHAEPGDVLALDLTCGLPEAQAAAANHAADDLAGLLDPKIAAALHNDLNLARDLRFVVLGPAEPERAQVTRGGLPTADFDPSTLKSSTQPGVFACGEALDVDGACGGFNLAWAWKSGMVAGAAAARYAQNTDL